MRIFSNVVAVPGKIIHAVLHEASAARARVKEAVHHVVDRVEALVAGPDFAGDGAPAVAKHIRKEAGHKKPRAERRRARRAAHAIRE